MALTFYAIRSGPAQSPQDIVQDCPLRKVLITVRARESRRGGPADLATQQVVVRVGGEEGRPVATDPNGYFTLEYRGDGALPDVDVAVTWTDRGRDGQGAMGTAVRAHQGPTLEVFTLTVLIAPRWLAITQRTPVFAPGAVGEALVLDYEIVGMEGAHAVIELRDNAQVLVHRAELPQPVSGQLRWDGRDVDGRWVTPLRSKFTARLFNALDELESDRVDFRVEYHSVEVTMGHWAPVEGWDALTPAPGGPGAVERRWVRFKLNTLGYWAGPRDGMGHYDRNACTRYRASHATLAFDAHQALVWDYAQFPQTGADLTNEPDRVAFLAALEHGDGGRPYFTRPAGLGRAQLATGDPLTLGAATDALRVHVEALPWMHNAALNELGEQYAPNLTKAQRDADRMNRPLLPLEAVIYLVGSDGQRKLSPGAVGAARVDWTFEEPQEDLGFQFADDRRVHSQPRSYIEAALRQHGGRVAPNAGNNCHAHWGGLRTGGDDHAAVFVVGGDYAPHVVADDGAVVHSAAHTGGVAGCLGKAGVFFRPSIIAGDAYRVRAAIHMAGVVADQQPLPAVTNPIEVWRCARVAVVLGWPVRDDLNGGVWADVKREYEKAYLDLDVSAVAGQPMTPMSTFLQAGDYQAWFAQWMAAAAAYYEDRLQNGSFLTLRNGIDVRDAEPYGMVATGERQLDDLWLRIATRVRPVHPSGAIVVAYRMAERDLGVAESDVSMSMANFGVLLNRLTEGRPYYIAAHELAHCLFLNHGAFTSQTFVADHDRSDHSCIMDYARPRPPPAWPHKSCERYAPHFCGRCNLKLRGWDINGAATALPASAARIRGCHWAAPRAPLGVGGPFRESPDVIAVVETLGVPDGTPAHIVVRDFLTHGVVMTFGGLEVIKGVVCVSPERFPTFRDTTAAGPPPWVRRRYEFEARVDAPTGPLVATTVAPLEIYAYESVVAYDKADEAELIAAPEAGHVTAAIEGVAGHGVSPLVVYRNADLKAWAARVARAYVYHHISHGGVQCQRDGHRADITELLPKYPAWCQGDRATLEDIQHAALTSFGAGKDCLPVFKRYITPRHERHPLRGAIQWVMDPADSRRDVLFTAQMISDTLTAGPQALVFLSCCVLGWERSMARAFMAKGTPYVIAFRCAYKGAIAGRLAAEFYDTWAGVDLNPARIPSIFTLVALKHPDAEPVLFAARQTLRVVVGRHGPDILVLEPDDDEGFEAPHIPARYRGQG